MYDKNISHLCNNETVINWHGSVQKVSKFPKGLDPSRELFEQNSKHSRSFERKDKEKERMRSYERSWREKKALSILAFSSLNDLLIQRDIYIYRRRIKTNNVRDEVPWIQAWIVILIFMMGIFRSKWAYFNWILFYFESLKM